MLELGRRSAIARFTSHLETRLRHLSLLARVGYWLRPELRRFFQLAELSAVCNFSALLDSVSPEKVVLLRQRVFFMRRGCFLRIYSFLDPHSFHIPQLRDFWCRGIPPLGVVSCGLRPVGRSNGRFTGLYGSCWHALTRVCQLEVAATTAFCLLRHADTGERHEWMLGFPCRCVDGA